MKSTGFSFLGTCGDRDWGWHGAILERPSPAAAPPGRVLSEKGQIIVCGAMERVSTDTMKSLNFYESHYDLAAKVVLLPDEKKFIGNRYKRRCRYCSRAAPAASFRMVAHAFPHFIGNRTLFGYDECDDCNRGFSRYAEHHFARYLGLERATSKIRGKRGVPTYKDVGRRSEVRFDGSTKGLRAEAHISGEFIFLDTDRKL